MLAGKPSALGLKAPGTLGFPFPCVGTPCVAIRRPSACTSLREDVDPLENCFGAAWLGMVIRSSAEQLPMHGTSHVVVLVQASGDRGILPCPARGFRRMDESWNPVSLDVPIMGLEEGLAPLSSQEPEAPPTEPLKHL